MFTTNSQLLQIVTVNNAIISDATNYQYAATLPIQLQVNTGATVNVMQVEQPIVPNAVTFAEAQDIEGASHFSE